ncbi:TPA: DNA topoisomerase III [Clostridioides difficile]|nr:DNA topoisomerase [Clostridioides difficile]HBF4280932.1 DNA topoisomerase III [Clostridioides difficile]
MKSVIIAEKPSLARTIVDAIKEDFSKKNGYYENNKYIVTYAFGHLFELLDIEDYLNREKTYWNINDIPFVPKEFKFKLKSDDGVKKQFNTIKELVNRSDVNEVISCGDADREGEVIIRLILNEIKVDKRVKRLWLPAQTEDDILKALSDLKDINKYDNLYLEGLLRTHVDWLYGINLTRLLTLKKGKNLPVGRVIIPIVDVIYRRDLEIEKFVSKDYFQPELIILKNGEEIRCNINELKFDSKRDCDSEVIKQKECNLVVENIEIKEVKKSPKKLFSLDKLQNKLSKDLKLSADESLKIIQKLYEKGYVTYPRTNTEYLAESEKERIKKLINIHDSGSNILEMKDKKSIFDDTKIESHSAIIPTEKLLKKEDLDSIETSVYNIIKNRFICNFLKEQTVLEETVTTLKFGKYEIKFKGTVIKKLGYLAYENDLKEKAVPKFSKGEKLDFNIETVRKKTQPPRHLSLEDLNNYLKNPFRNDEMTEDEEYNLMLKGVEIGTVATRAEIINKAKRLQYIEEKQGTFFIKELGKILIKSLEDLNINMDKNKTVELSKILKQVYRREIESDKAIKIYSDDLVNTVNNSKAIEVKKIDSNVKEKEIIGICPKCKKNIFEGPKSFYCEGYKDINKCTFYISKEDKFFQNRGKKLTKSMVKNLLKDGNVKVKGFKKKDGSGSYDAIVNMDIKEKWVNFSLQFENKKIKR